MQAVKCADTVATHQKTQQGLKRIPGTPLQPLSPRRNASENPTGIETLEDNVERTKASRNASENPTGIETDL